MGKRLGIDFFWIIVDLGCQVGAKLGRKIEPRQAKTGQDKGRQGKRREGKGKEEEGKGLEGKGVENGGIGDLSPGGGGVHPTFRGRPPRDPRPGGSRGVGDSYCDFFGNLAALLFCIVFRCLFGSILAPVSLPTCLPKSTKNRSEMALKNDEEKKSNEIAKKVTTRIPNVPRPDGSWVSP